MPYDVLAAPVFGVDDLTTVLLIGAAVLIASIVAVRLSVHSGLPSLLYYLAIGLLIGEAGFGIRFDSANLTRVLGYAALILILAEGGLTTRWSSVRQSVAPAAVLSTVGVAVSVSVVAVAAHVVLHVSWTVALLIGAIVSSTDAAAVFSVLRNVPLPRRITGLLEAESGINDAPVVILVVTLAAQAMPGAEPEPWYLLVVLAALELVGGALVGLAVGHLGARLMKRFAARTSGLFSIGIVALTVLAYAVAASAHTSGFLATYVSGVVLGNMRLPHRVAVHGFATALGWLAQIGLFVLLGLLASPARMPGQIVPALVIGLVLLLVARPLSVLVSVTPFRVPWRDQVFLSWAGLRGAVPVVLATVPLTMGTPDTGWLFDLVFVLVIVFTVVQAPTLPWVARRLGVIEADAATDVELESTLLDELGAEVVQVSIGLASRLNGVGVVELRLPTGAQVALVARAGTTFVPDRMAQFRHGDRLLIVTTAAARSAVEARVRAVSRDGRLAGWV
ncbi:MAG TPA: potassium/proton antiporter [Candidatus Lustribacter sp.]|nr:potassium/proton antiporter [Candidatus Lustribacter sp.]